MQVTGGRGCGGAIHVENGFLNFSHGWLEGNSGIMMSIGARDVSGGGVCVNDKAEVILVNVTMQSNMVGGSGFYESVSAYRPVAEQNRKARAAHIECAGKLTLHRCSVFDEAKASGNVAVAWLSGRNFGRLVLIDTRLTSTSVGTIALVLAEHSAALLRNCSATNVSIANDGAVGAASGSSEGNNLGIVHSTFDPRLALTVPTIGDSACARPVASLEPMCDPRASCVMAQSGGVRCRCADNGLREKDGSRGEGSVCERQASLASQLVTPKIRLAVTKPGNSSSVVLQVCCVVPHAATQCNIA